MSHFTKKEICIIGAGKVGTTMAAIITATGGVDFELKAVSTPRKHSIEQLKEILGNKSKNILFYNDNIECAKVCNCLFICTPDDKIEQVCRQITETLKEELRGKLFIHLSGAKTLEVFKTAEKHGAFSASIHPIKSFASVEKSIISMPGTIYGVTLPEKCPADIKKFIYCFIEKTKGRPVEVPDRKKSVYHAAACIASNYLVSLINYSVKVHEKVGINQKDSLEGLVGLIEGTIENIKALGTKKSLTGPIARGDTGTIKEHMDNLNKYFKQEEVLVYIIMGIETARLAYENKWIDKKTLDNFLKILSPGKNAGKTAGQKQEKEKWK